MDDAMARFEKYKEVLPQGVCSSHRNNPPLRIFERAKGAYMWDHEGRRYIDFHAAFAPMLLGHNDDDVNQAILEGFEQGCSLFGAGVSPWEEQFARLVVESVPSVAKAVPVNSGSEATYLAIRVARASTGRDKVIIMQGGYNGWHNDVAFNLQNPWDDISSYVPGEPMPQLPFTNGMPANQRDNTVVVQYNDLEAVEKAMKTGEVAGIILEPILQNIGLVKPNPGYLKGLRDLCDTHGCVLIFDEVKTGFRYALGGYQSICGITPDLCTFGKAVANGYPMGVVGGTAEFVDYFLNPDPDKYVLVAGTYNGHFVGTLAAIATLTKLRDRGSEIYPHIDGLGARMEAGLTEIWGAKGVPFHITRQGSAWATYLMDREPENWGDIAQGHDAELDMRFRQAAIEAGVYVVPMPTKQWSASFAHTVEDIEKSLEIIAGVVKAL